VGVLLIWSILSYGGYVLELFLPTPTAIIQRGRQIEKGILQKDAAISVYRIGWAGL